MINRLRDDEVKKSQLNSKSTEMRLRAAEDAKEGLLRKVNDMTKALQDKDRHLQNMERDKID